MNFKIKRALRDPFGFWPEYFDPGDEVVMVSDGEYALLLPAVVFDELDEVGLRTLFESRKESEQHKAVQ